MFNFKDPYKFGFVVLDNVLAPGHLSGSTRIRVKYVAKYLKNSVISEDVKELKQCDVIMFQSRFTAIDVELAKSLKEQNKIILLDLTDPQWDERYKGNNNPIPSLDAMVELSDCVTLCSEELLCMFQQAYPNAITSMIPDRIDLETCSKIKRHTNHPEYKVMWHGDYGNIRSLELARSALENVGKDFDITLVCVYNRHLTYPIQPFKNIKLECREWSEDNVVDALLESDVSINPKFDDWRSYKTNNKTVAAWTLGVPCVERHFEPHLRALLPHANLRNLEGERRRKEVEVYYDSKLSASELNNLVSSIMKHKRFNVNKYPEPKNVSCVYTSIVGGVDDLIEEQNTELTDYIAFLEEFKESKTWDVVKVERMFHDNCREAKIYKCLPHQFLSEYDYTLWIDGTFGLRVPIKYLIETYLQDADMAMYIHPERDCVYEEAKVDMGFKKDSDEVIKRQLNKYLAAGFPEHAGLYACGILLRKNNAKMEAFNNDWWSEICAGSKRDQWSFSYCVRKHNIKINFFQGGVYYYNDYFSYTPHVKSRLMEKVPSKIVEGYTRGQLKVGYNPKVAWITMDDLTGVRNYSTLTRVLPVTSFIKNSQVSSAQEVIDASDVIIYQDRVERCDLDSSRKAAAQGKVIIVDLTIPIWNTRIANYSGRKAEHLLEMSRFIDCIVVPTQEMATECSSVYPWCQVKVIPTRVDLMGQNLNDIARLERISNYDVTNSAKEYLFIAKNARVK